MRKLIQTRKADINDTQKTINIEDRWITLKIYMIKIYSVSIQPEHNYIKTSGDDNITNELLQYGEERLTDELKNLFQ